MKEILYTTHMPILSRYGAFYSAQKYWSQVDHKLKTYSAGGVRFAFNNSATMGSRIMWDDPAVLGARNVAVAQKEM
jgi:hypothetical protein